MISHVALRRPSLTSIAVGNVSRRPSHGARRAASLSQPLLLAAQYNSSYHCRMPLWTLLSKRTVSLRTPSLKGLRQHGVAREGFLVRYRRYSKAFPYMTAFVVCFTKGMASDVITQVAVEGKSFDLRRNAAFALYSGSYCGCVQHFVFNVAFTRLFGLTGNVLPKVFVDAAVHAPFMYLPACFVSKSALLEGDPIGGLNKYRENMWETCSAYWKVWPVASLIMFGVMPPEVRISFMAAVSFFWLIGLSFIANKSDDKAVDKEQIASTQKTQSIANDFQWRLTEFLSKFTESDCSLKALVNGTA